MSKTRIMLFVTMAAMLLSQPKVSAQNSDFTMFDWIEEEQDYLMFDWIDDGYEDGYNAEALLFQGMSTKFKGMFDYIDELLPSSDGGYALFNQQFGVDDNGGYELYNQTFGQNAGFDVPLGSGLLILATAGVGYAFKKRKSNLKW